MIEKFLLEMPQLTLGYFQRKRGKYDNFDLCYGNFFWQICWSKTQSCNSKSHYIKVLEHCVQAVDEKGFVE